jgi:hypothetical protein
MGKETNPKLVFERLFASHPSSEAQTGGDPRSFWKRSILDFVGEDAARLHSKLGAADRRKLDEYLTGVRELERRISRGGPAAANRPGPPAATGPAGIPDDYQEHIRLMCDMLALAFQSDLTRVATFMLANAGSNRSYRMIGVPEGHHNLSHHGGDPEKHAKIRCINRFHVSQFAYLLEKLKSINEGGGSLLDNCLIAYGSGISDGNRHNNEDLPVLLAGRGGGAIRTGRHLRYEPETPMTNLFLAMLDSMGAPVESLGDSTGRLPYLGSDPAPRRGKERLVLRQSEDAPLSKSRVDDVPTPAQARTGQPSEQELIEALQAPDVEQRRDAAYALAQLGEKAATANAALIQALDDRDPQVWAASVRAVARIGPGAAAAIPKLLSDLGGRNRQRQYRSAYALGCIGEAAIPGLLEALQSHHATVRAGAARSLSWMGAAAKPAVPQLMAALEDEASVLQLSAAALGEVGAAARSALPALRELQRRDDTMLREVVTAAIRKIER